MKLKVVWACFALLSYSCSVKSQSISESREFVEHFFASRPPCIEDFYCYEYSFAIKNNDIVIGMKLFNYKNKVKFVKDTMTFIIPIQQIRRVEYFPGNSEDIFLVTKGDNIKRIKNGQEDFLGSLPIDFNKYTLTREIKADFKNHLEAIIHP